MLSRLLPATAAAVVLLAAPAGAAGFKVVKATHTSSSTKQENDYRGTSTASWALARPGRLGFQGTGMATLKVDGQYGIDASTSGGHCAWTAPTGGGGDYAALAPEEATLMLAPDPRTGKGLLATYTGVRATLSNAYLPSECSTSISGEPSPEETSAIPVKPAALKKKRVILRFKGATSEEGIDYRWSTTFVLTRR